MHLNLPEGMTKAPQLDVEYVINQDCSLFRIAEGSGRFLSIGVDGLYPKTDRSCPYCKGRVRIVSDNDRYPAAILPKECKKDETIWDKIADLVARIPRPKTAERVVETTPKDWEKIK